MWSIVNIEKTLSPPPLLPPFPTQFHASFPAPFQSMICSPPRSPLRSPFRSTLRSTLRSLFYSVHCGLKKTKFYRLITLENYWTCRTTLTSYRCARLTANSSQQYTSLNYYTKQLVFSRRSRTRAQSNERSGARMKTENETGEELFLSPSWFWENWQTDKRIDFAQPTCDFCFQRLENLVLALQTNAGFPASRGLSLLSLIFASSWETSASRETPVT